MAGTIGSEDGEFGLQIAPMLDVMFVLLLFFMVTAGVTTHEQELGLQLPQGHGIGDLPIVLKVSKDNTVLFNDTLAASPEDSTMKGLQESLSNAVSHFKHIPIIIAPDPEVRHERVIQVMDACSYAKVEKLAFRYAAVKP